jgi:transcriptional regulator with XRE-family HTH domain
MARKPHPLIAELAAVREAAELTVWEAARRAGLAAAVVRDWETGRCEPTVVSLEKYLSVLNRRLFTAVTDVEARHRDAVLALELEAIPRRPTPIEVRPVTAEGAAKNRRVLAEALGIVDDMPTPTAVGGAAA